MLLNFTFSNFRSFPKDTTLNMLATKTVSEDKAVDQRNKFDCAAVPNGVLKIAAIYGANASGKSNIIKAMQFVKSFVLNSSREGQIQDSIPADPFLLDAESPSLPTGFEVYFFTKGIKYRYGFEIYKGTVVSEWLYRVKTNKIKIFIRDHQSIELGREISTLGGLLKTMTRPNALFLSVLAQFNNETATQIVSWFREIEFISPDLQASEIDKAAREIMQDDDLRILLSNIIKSLDVGIDSVVAEESKLYSEESLKDFSESLRARFSTRTIMRTRTVHKVYDLEGNTIDEVFFDLNSQESDGTRKLFSIILPLVQALTSGGIVVIDEMDARLHPLLTTSLMGLFSLEGMGEKCAQLIFTTHDTNLLSKDLLRRDQVWFVEKSSTGASELYSLVQYQSKNNAPFSKNYLMGKYGAIPFPNTNLIAESIVSNSLPKEKESHGS